MYLLATPTRACSSSVRVVRRVSWCALAAGIALVFSSASAQEPTFPSDSTLHSLLRDLVPDSSTTGIVVGLLNADGSRRVIAHGSSGETGTPLDAGSVFEIGSITKVFTGVLLAEMVRRNEVDLLEPFARLLPPSVRMPSRNGREILLLDMITHTSGLPAMPANFPEDEGPAAYASYTVDRMYEFLSAHELTRDPGESFEYSNMAALVGHALAARVGKSFDSLLRERILAPLEMHHTAIEPTPEMQRHRAQGHDFFGSPAPDFVTQAFAPSGGLDSTVEDLLTFAEASLSAADTPLHAALRYAQLPQREIGGEEGYMGLGWATGPVAKGYSTAHAGGSFGYSSSIRLDPTTRRAVVVLANFSGDVANPIGLHLLHPEFPRPLPSIGQAVAAVYRRRGVEAAIRHYRVARESAPDRWRFEESELNTLGYQMLARGAVADAIQIFRLNVEVHPGSPNPYDSLGDAYMAAGRVDQAIESYRRAVELAEALDDPNLPLYRENLERAIEDRENRRR